MCANELSALKKTKGSELAEEKPYKCAICTNILQAMFSKQLDISGFEMYAFAKKKVKSPAL